MVKSFWMRKERPSGMLKAAFATVEKGRLAECTNTGWQIVDKEKYILFVL